MEENIGYLQRIELLAALVVSTLLQLLIELGASLLSISSDGLLPRPGRNPENRAGLTPAWCNFVNPLAVIIMLNVEHESHESFILKQLIRLIRAIRVQ